MIAIMWQFDVKDGRETEFEQFYGVDGKWTALNRHTRSYLGTSFLRDQNRSSRYIVIEYWSEMIVYEQHRESGAEAIVVPGRTAFDACRLGRAAGSLHGARYAQSGRADLVTAQTDLIGEGEHQSTGKNASTSHSPNNAEPLRFARVVALICRSNPFGVVVW